MDTLFGTEDLQPSLPAPSGDRFRPLRAGILNVWQYDRHEFWFRDGRLILRGENGSGKSKALEVLLPFLFDADLSPTRLDPFAGQSRTMRWNLLEGDNYPSRLGYVWLEFGRLDAAGRAVIVTLGAGLRATRSNSGVDSWYWVSEGPRVGSGFDLVLPTGHPLSKQDLRGRLEGNGQLFERAADYRECVDKVMFGLGHDRFAALRHLLLHLRRPHLSEKLDPGALSALLAESLPPVDAELIAQLAEGFERLDREKDELLHIERAGHQVLRFAAVYSEYCRGVARLSAAAVRIEESGFHRAAAAVRQAEQRLAVVVETLGGLDQARRENESKVHATRGEIRALEQSEAWRTIQDLEDKRQHSLTLEQNTRQAEADRSQAETELASLVEVHQGAQAADQSCQQALAARNQEAVPLAVGAGLEAVHTSAFERLETLGELAAAAPTKIRATIRDTIRAAIEDRRQAIRDLRTARSELERFAASVQDAEQRRRDAAALAQAATDRTGAAKMALDAARSSFDEAMLQWASALIELQLPAVALDELRAVASALAEQNDADPGEFQRRILALAAPSRDALIGARTAAAANHSALEAERGEVSAECEQLQAARDLEPAPPPTRDASRAQRPGAPFYRLCEFKAGLDAAARTGLEAALQDSGLLDAWVRPDGTLLLDVHDTVLSPTAELANPEDTRQTLEHALVALDDAAVDAEVTVRVLRSIELGDATDYPYNVGFDGSWRLGPLHGRWSKPEVEYLGAAAREAARRRRIAELERRRDELAQAMQTVTRSIEAITQRIDRLDREVASVPQTFTIQKAHATLDTTAAEERRRGEELAGVEAETAALRKQHDRATTELATRAHELRLATRLADLDGYEAALDAYHEAVHDLLEAVMAAVGAQRELELVASRLAVSQARCEEHGQRAERCRLEATRAAAELATLEAALGSDAQTILSQHADAGARLLDLEHRTKALAEQVAELREERGASTQQVADGTATRQAADDARKCAAQSFAVALGTGLLSFFDAGADDEPLTADRCRALPHRRLIELARRVAAETAEIDIGPDALNRRDDLVLRRFEELRSELEPDQQVLLERVDNISVVTVLHNSEHHDIPAIRRLLEDEAETRRNLLADRERDLLRKFLLGEVGGHLRGRLREAERLVENMNEQLEGCATASGFRLRLRWKPDPKAAENVREVVKLLRHDLDILPDHEQKTVASFLQERIAAARSDLDAVPWAEHLACALDYRDWHRFTIMVQTPEDTGWHELTRQSHGAKSGGEKSVALHLPLFAAAAAHYSSARPTAPRLIMLDEAFAGIDQGMKGRCMGLLVQLDLDFVMTSHDEWGCYAELPGVATYQLYRNPDIGSGVATVRFEWDGQERVECGAGEAGEASEASEASETSG